jgi:hypothetical protein
MNQSKQIKLWLLYGYSTFGCQELAHVYDRWSNQGNFNYGYCTLFHFWSPVSHVYGTTDRKLLGQLRTSHDASSSGLKECTNSLYYVCSPILFDSKLVFVHSMKCGLCWCRLPRPRILLCLHSF